MIIGTVSFIVLAMLDSIRPQNVLRIEVSPSVRIYRHDGANESSDKMETIYAKGISQVRMSLNNFYYVEYLDVKSKSVDLCRRCLKNGLLVVVVDCCCCWLLLLLLVVVVVGCCWLLLLIFVYVFVEQTNTIITNTTFQTIFIKSSTTFQSINQSIREVQPPFNQSMLWVQPPFNIY